MNIHLTFDTWWSSHPITARFGQSMCNRSEILLKKAYSFVGGNLHYLATMPSSETYTAFVDFNELHITFDVDGGDAW